MEIVEGLLNVYKESPTLTAAKLLSNYLDTLISVDVFFKFDKHQILQVIKCKTFTKKDEKSLKNIIDKLLENNFDLDDIFGSISYEDLDSLRKIYNYDNYNASVESQIKTLTKEVNMLKHKLANLDEVIKKNRGSEFSLDIIQGTGLLLQKINELEQSNASLEKKYNYLLERFNEIEKNTTILKNEEIDSSVPVFNTKAMFQNNYNTIHLRNNDLHKTESTDILSLSASAIIEPDIICAIKHNNLTQLKSLVSASKDVILEKDSFGRTGIHWACEMGNLQMVEYLHENGADINAKDNSVYYFNMVHLQYLLPLRAVIKILFSTL